MNTIIQDVTPLMAAAWLLKNDNNRNIRPALVDRLKRDMSAGLWKSNGETIKFDCVGNLIDGQHRLMACVASAVTLKSVVVVRGIDLDCYLTIDTGQLKSFSDVIGSRGERNATTLAGAARLIVIWDNGKLSFNASPMTPSSQEMISVVEKYESLRDVANYVASRRIHGMTTSMAGLIGLSASLAGQWERFDLFYDRVRRGESITKTDPEFLLRAWLGANCGIRTKTAKPGFILAMCIKAWNYAAEEKQIRTLLIRPGEGFPVLEHPKMDGWKK